MLRLQRIAGFTRCFSTVAKERLKRSEWESVVGLEVHAQIQASSKLFSRASSQFGAPVNSQVSLFDAAIPGTLPVLNKGCVEAAVMTGAALSCRINMTSFFDRKHYFYSDLPAGYQITQYRQPIAEYGTLKFLVIIPDGKTPPYYKTCRIRQIQLEQDSGKSLHDEELNRSLIDLNRAGIPLMELVFQPDLQSGEEAAALVKELCLILETLNTCSCKMEEGALRVDANISVNRKGEGLGVRTEIKNLSSLRSLVGAIEYEIDRQLDLIENGGIVTNETRSYDADRKMTLPMRDKEVKQDYRFMPEPNLPQLKLTASGEPGLLDISKCIAAIPELPDSKRDRLVREFKLRIEVAHAILNVEGCLAYFEAVMSYLLPEYGVRAGNFLMTEVLEHLNDADLTFSKLHLAPEKVAEIVKLVETKAIHVSTAKDVLNIVLRDDNRSPTEIVKENGWLQVIDSDLILNACQAVIKANPKLVSDYNTKRKQKQFNKLVVLVKESTQEKIDMKQVTDTLKELLSQK